MKNTHIIPTDKPSRLFKYDNQVLNLHTHSVLKGIFTNGIGSNQHIYITSDEEIKEGVNQWYLDKFLNKPRNSSGSQYGENQNVIILTTDQDLIKDGVQAIDDEFLEWFVQNPSCEEVEIGEGVRYEDEWIDNEDGGEIFQHQYSCYKIIIPKEEQKQDYSGVHVRHCYQGEYEDGCKYGEDDCPAKPLEEPKQLTDLEIAENKKNLYYCKQVMNPYSVEEYSHTAYEKGFIEGYQESTKWQSERMYSEEEVIELLQKALTHRDNGETGNLITAQGEIRTANFYSWFEQFKKK